MVRCSHGLFSIYRGKTVVHWQATKGATEESLLQLCCLNDRFALDGLSPPSYGGVLWCYGWQDKPAPGNRVSEKWAHRYRTGPSGFVQAKEELLERQSSPSINPLFRNSAAISTGKRKENTNNGIFSKTTDSPSIKKAKGHNDMTDSKNILSYFAPTGAKQIG